MSKSGRPARISKRNNKGVPPWRLGFSDEDMPLPRTPTEASADGSMTEHRTAFGSSIEDAVSAASNSATTANRGAEVSSRDVAEAVSRATTNGAASKNSIGNGIEQITVDFNRKMMDMQNEFQRQMHELGRMFADNSKQIQTSVQALQQEMVSIAPIEYTETPTISAQNAAAIPEPLHLVNASQLIESNFSANSQQIMYAKLVDLPPFRGDPLDWPMFERSFLDTTQEFNYSHTRYIICLRAALHGDAKVAVDALLPYPDSVPEIMSTLRENFGRPDQIINTQVMEIRKITPIPTGNISLIIPFANKVKNMTAFVRYAKAEQRLCDVTLLSELVAKIPVEEQMKWAEYKEKLQGYANIDNFGDCLSIIAKRANIIVDSLPRAAMAAVKKRILLTYAQERCLICNDNCGNWQATLGWVVYGSYAQNQVSCKSHLLLARRSDRLEELEHLLKYYFVKENFGISPKCAPLLSDEDQRAITIMKTTVGRIKDRFEVGLLWALDSVLFPNSFEIAKKWLEGIEK